LSLGNLPQLVKASSDPSIATNQDNLDRDRDIIGEGLPPPYTVRGRKTKTNLRNKQAKPTQTQTKKSTWHALPLKTNTKDNQTKI